MLEFIAADDELLHIRWSGTSRAAQYEAHGRQLELVLGAYAPGRAFCTGITRTHPGVLAAKVRHFASNLLKCTRGQMGTKPAKVGHLAPGAI